MHLGQASIVHNEEEAHTARKKIEKFISSRASGVSCRQVYFLQWMTQAMHFSYKLACQTCLLSLLLASLDACLMGPDFVPPASPKVKYYTEWPRPCRTVSSAGHAGARQYFILGGDTAPQWWHSFHSKKLNKLVCTGIAHSPNLMLAKAVLSQAQHNFDAVAGGLFPAFSAQLAAQRGLNPVRNQANLAANLAANRVTNRVTQAPAPLGNLFNLFNTSVNVSYLLDIFGATRRQIEALKAQIHYQRYEWEAAYLTLSGNIVTSTIALASVQTQIELTKQLIREQQQQLHIMQQQFKLGGISGIEVLAQKTQVSQTRATLPPLMKSKAQLRHALAVLVGSLPSCADIPKIDLSELKLPTRLFLSVPSQLVHRRPDILAAEALVKVANAHIGVATANLYPQITLNGSYGESNTLGSQLFSAESQAWNIGAGFLQPLFRGGTLFAQRRAAFAVHDQALAQYRYVVLQAFQNVADVLRALETDAQELYAQKQAQLAARAQLNLVRQQFSLGGVSYLSLLDAQRQYQQTRIALIQARASRLRTQRHCTRRWEGGGWSS